MTNLVPFNQRTRRIAPFEINNFSDMLDDFFTDMWSPRMDFSKDTFKIDVQDNETDYLIEADMPGIEKDEISLEMKENTLCISVNKSEEKTEEKKNYVHKERRVSSMSRSVYLRDVKQDEIEAKLENGVLQITVPKVEQADKVKQISIK